MTGQPMPDARAVHDPLASFSLDTLLAGAARLRPETIAVADGEEMLTYAAAAARAAALARLLASLGLRAGERVVLCGGASVSACVALVAILRAGIDVAMAPLDLPAVELAAYAHSVAAVALIGTTRYGAPVSPETYLAAAAEAPSIRFVGTLGPDEVDETIDLGAAAISHFAAASPDDGLERGKPPAAAPPHIITRDRPRGTPVVHRQSTLIAAALDLIARARIGRRTPILTTLPPASLAGLVAGPIAALLAGAELHLHGPFAAARFLAALDHLRDPHLVVPAAIAADLLRANTTDGLSSLILRTRFSTAAAFAAPHALASSCPIVDLYAVGECAAVPEPRREGRPSGLAAEPHFITFDGTRILAVQTVTRPSGDIDLDGAAVTSDRRLA